VSHFTQMYSFLLCMTSPVALVSSRRILWRWQTKSSSRRSA